MAAHVSVDGAPMVTRRLHPDAESTDAGVGALAVEDVDPGVYPVRMHVHVAVSPDEHFASRQREWDDDTVARQIRTAGYPPGTGVAFEAPAQGVHHSQCPLPTQTDPSFRMADVTLDIEAPEVAIDVSSDAEDMGVLP